MARKTTKARKSVKARKSAKPQSAVDYDLESWLAGYDAGVCQLPIEPPKMIEIISRGVPTAVGLAHKVAPSRPSWLAGYVEVAAGSRVRAVANNIRFHGGEADNRSEYCGVGTVGYNCGFKQGVRLAARNSWRHDVV